MAEWSLAGLRDWFAQQQPAAVMPNGVIMPEWAPPRTEMGLSRPGDAQGADWSRYNQPYGEIRGTAPEDTPVVFQTPNVRITEGDITRGIDVGMGVSGGGLTFGGRIAKTADHAALARAEEMATAGKAPVEIRAATGWFKGADDKWRFEIPDKASQWKVINPKNIGEKPVAMGDVFYHPDLYEAYPELAKIPLNADQLGGNIRGTYQPSGITLSPGSMMRDTNLHELQHAVQDIEGFARGAPATNKEISRLSAGEVEARNVERRADWDLAKLRRISPEASQDVPFAQQQVTMISGAPINAANTKTGGPAKGIKAYHGSPHDFDRFDLSKIGTGEGAQAYGHGLYFADSENVAKSYRDALGGTSTLDGVPTGKVALQGYGAGAKITPEQQIADYISSYGTLQNARFSMANRRPELLPIFDELEKSGRLKAGGHMYEVNINADPAKFLDWDKPLGGNPAAIEALKTHGGFTDVGRNTLISPRGHMARPDDRFEKVYQDLGASLQEPGQQFWNYPAASKVFTKAGIPGIKYLDQGSRGAGTGSSNYVVFNDKLIDIMRKYGLAGLAPLAGAGAVAGQQQAQPQM